MGDFFDDRLWENEDWDADDNENDGDGNESDYAFISASHVVALIDCHPDMFQHVGSFSDITNDNDTKTVNTPFEASLVTLEILMQQKIEDTVIRKTGKRNGVGVVLYNTKPIRPASSMSSQNKRNSNPLKEDDDDDGSDEDDDDYIHNDIKGESSHQEDLPPQWMVQELLSLEPPGIKSVQTIQNFRSRKQDRNLQEEFCPSTLQAKLQQESSLTPLQNAIETAMRIFKSAKCVHEDKLAAKKGGKNKNRAPEKDVCSIWIFTNRDAPYTNRQGIDLVTNVAREAIDDMGINIVVWPLPIIDRSNGVVNSKSHTIKIKTECVDEDKYDDDDQKQLFDSDFYKVLFSGEFFFNTRFTKLDVIEDKLQELDIETRKNRKMYTTPFHILAENTASMKEEEKVGSNEKDDGNKAVSAPSHSSQPPMMVDWYAVTSQCRRPGRVKIDNETKLKVKRTKIWADKDTDAEIARFGESSTVDEKERQQNMPVKKRIRKTYQFVNEPIPMDPRDTQQMKMMGCQLKNPGLVVLGFKPQNSIPSYHRLKHAFLIYPTDDEVSGSTSAFSRLHAAMIRKNVLAVGQFWLRQSWEWRYCAIRPLPSQPNHLGNGMLVVLLPFRDDLRTVEPDAASLEFANRQQVASMSSTSKSESKSLVSALPSDAKTAAIKQEPVSFDDMRAIVNDQGEEDDGSQGNIATEDLILSMMKLMSKLKLEEEEVVLGNLLLQNPSLVDFHNYLTSIAFGVSHRKVENSLLRPTKEDEKKLTDKIRKEVEDIISKLPANVEKTKALRKRTKELVPDTSGLDWEDLLTTGKIKTCKIDELKSYLRSVGESLTGRKDDLLLRVSSHLQSHLQQQSHQQKKIKSEEGITMDV